MKRKLDGPHLALLLILVAEFLAFSGSFGKFFNHDSLFYLVHAPRSWDQFAAVMAGPDPTQQYRPMTLAVMSLLLPYFRLDYMLYHWVPIVFHLFNTILFWALARRLLYSQSAALAATAFWGLHSAVAYVTYDIGYFPDFLMAAFGTASLILAVDAFRTGSRFRAGIALLLYMGALLSKEAMVALPAAVLVCLVLAAVRDSGQLPSWRGLDAYVRKALPLTCLYLAVAFVHACRLFYWLMSDRLYAQGTNPAYHIGLLGNLAAKARYFFWALNLPDQLVVPHPNRNRMLALLLMGLILLVWALNIARRRGRLLASEIGGIVWLSAMLTPVYLLSNRTAKWYLYIPVMGLAFAVGAGCSGWDGLRHRLSARWMGPAVVALVMTAMYFSSSVQVQSVLNSSDSAFASDIVRNCLNDFGRIYPSLPASTTLFVLATRETDVTDYFGGGRLYQLFYPGKQIRMVFADKGERLPPDFAGRGDLRILRYLYGHVYDDSDYYKGRRLERNARRVIRDLTEVRATVNRREFYPSYDSFGTPGGTPAFFATPDKDIFTQIGGSVVTAPLGEVPPEARLRFDVSWMHDQGDGAWAELAIRADGREEVLFKRFMQPNKPGEGLRWGEVDLDLRPYAGKKADLVLSCTNAPGSTTVADWLNWRDIQLIGVRPTQAEFKQ